MKSILTLPLLLLISWSLSIAQIKTPQPSPLQTITQRIGITDITVEYSRPGVKGRKVFGDLVPYGELWRTGANAATKVSSEGGFMFGTLKVEPGEYSLFTIPDKTEWTIILNRDPKTNTTRYDQSRDVGRFKVKAAKAPVKYETFTIDFTNLGDSTALMRLLWDQTMIEIPISTPVDAQVMSQIEQEVIRKTPENPNLYFQAANYYFNTNRNLEQALEWATKAVEADRQYWKVHLQAKLYEKLGRCPDAVRAAEESKKLSQEGQNPTYVKMNEELIARCGKK